MIMLICEFLTRLGSLDMSGALICLGSLLSLGFLLNFLFSLLNRLFPGMYGDALDGSSKG